MRTAIGENSRRMSEFGGVDKQTIETLNTIAKVDTDRKMLEDIFAEETEYFGVVNRILLKNFNLLRVVKVLLETLQQNYKKHVDCRAEGTG